MDLLFVAAAQVAVGIDKRYVFFLDCLTVSFAVPFFSVTADTNKVYGLA
ncbi:hypothetical protein [Glutamicibacter sp.]